MLVSVIYELVAGNLVARRRYDSFSNMLGQGTGRVSSGMSRC